MKLTTNTKILRKILILCVLTVGLVFVASDEATPVLAKSCYDANNDFYGALNTFDTGFYSYYYNDPTSCNTECSGFPLGSSEYNTCYNNCRQTRRTTLDNAQLGILQAGSEIDSCTNPEPDRCTNARGMNDYCLATYNYSEYSDLEQRLDIFSAYSECRRASGVDSCQ